MGLVVEDLNTAITITLTKLKSLEDRNELVKELCDFIESRVSKYSIEIQDSWMEPPRGNKQ